MRDGSTTISCRPTVFILVEQCTEVHVPTDSFIKSVRRSVEQRGWTLALSISDQLKLILLPAGVVLTDLDNPKVPVASISPLGQGSPKFLSSPLLRFGTH
jgi:hypothetical protein